MKKIALVSVLGLSVSIFAQQQPSNSNNSSYNTKGENQSFYNANSTVSFENYEAMHDIGKYYFEIKKYINSKKEQLSKEDYKNLMKQNEEDFTLINGSVSNTGAKSFLNQYSEDLEKYKKRIFEKVDLLAKN